MSYCVSAAVFFGGRIEGYGRTPGRALYNFMRECEARVLAGGPEGICAYGLLPRRRQYSVQRRATSTEKAA